MSACSVSASVTEDSVSGLTQDSKHVSRRYAFRRKAREPCGGEDEHGLTARDGQLVDEGFSFFDKFQLAGHFRAEPTLVRKKSLPNAAFSPYNSLSSLISGSKAFCSSTRQTEGQETYNHGKIDAH